MVGVAHALSQAGAPLWTSQPLAAWHDWPALPRFQPLELLRDVLAAGAFPQLTDEAAPRPLSAAHKAFLRPVIEAVSVNDAWCRRGPTAAKRASMH